MKTTFAVLALVSNASAIQVYQKDFDDEKTGGYTEHHDKLNDKISK